jgi:hypothetical protein
VPVPCSAVFLFQKSYTRNILGIGRNKSRTSRNLPKLPENRRGDGEEPHHQGVRPRAWLRPPVVMPPRSTSDAAPSPIKTPRREKPKHPDHFSRIHHDLLPPSTRDREGLEALPDTLPERRIATRGLLHRHACLRRDE